MRLVRNLAILVLAILILAAVPAIYIGVVCTRNGDGSTATSSLVPPEIRAKLDAVPGYREDEARTYLSFPDWYAIYVARDYARFIDTRYPSGFAFFTAAAEYWTGYCAVNRRVSTNYDFDAGTYVATVSYGISHSVKYALNGLYENTIGRLSEAFAPVPATGEDVFARDMADDYSAWLLSAPWYDYPFFRRLGQLWSTVPFGGSGQVRKIERRFALSAELGINGVHGAFFKDRPQAGGEPQAEIRALMKGLPADPKSIDGRIGVVEAYPGGLQLVAFPRREIFSEIVRKSVGRGVQFIEIAGNDDILITVLGPRGWSPPEGAGEHLFDTAVLSGSGGVRAGLSVPVPQLLEAIAAIEAAGGRFEHIYDY